VINIKIFKPLLSTLFCSDKTKFFLNYGIEIDFIKRIDFYYDMFLTFFLSFQAVPRSMAGLAGRLSGMMPTPSARGRKGWCGCLQVKKK
jgi:hypothetical protein